MYNGIGLSTVRGSGTNGYVTRNLSHVRPSKDKVNYKTEEDIKKSEAALSRGPNQGILDHERKRKLDVKCLELEDVLKDQGCDDEEIEEKFEAYIQMLLGVEQDKGAFQDVGPNQGILDHERERKLEVKCLELEDILKDLGCNDEEIEECTLLYMQLELRTIF